MATHKAASFLSLPLLLFCYLISSGSIAVVANAQRTWCVAKPSSDPKTLLDNINYACSQVDCSVIHNGGICFSPDTIINHASVVMNTYFQCKGRNPWNCDFKGSGLVTITNPSYGTCNYFEG